MIFIHRQNDIGRKSNVDVFKFQGIEIDLRSSPNGIVLTHDRVDYSKCNSYFRLEDVIDKIDKYTVICNIKESGIEEEIINILSNKVNFLFLDSQLPDIIRLSEKYKGKFIIRVSDMESINYNLIKLSKPKFIWVDYSKFSNFSVDDYRDFILEVDHSIEKNIDKILVSPELYSLNYIDLIKEIIPLKPKNWSVCTKVPSLWDNVK